MHEEDIKLLSNEKLFELYQKNKSCRIKQEITLRYAYISRSVAYQMRDFYRSQLDYEDVIQEGILTIMEGIDRFEPSKKVSFSTFINIRLRGMVIDLMRKNSWLPRTFYQDRKKIEHAEERLRLHGADDPTDEEVMACAGLNAERYFEVERLSGMMNVLSIDKPFSETGEESFGIRTDEENVYPEKVLLRAETSDILKQCIEMLPEREQTILSLYYVEEMKTVDIADIMGISQPRVSQIHRRAIKKLRKKMDYLEERGECHVSGYV